MRDLRKLVAVVALVVMAIGGAANGTELKLLSAWDDRYPGVRIIADAYIDSVGKATDGKLVIKRSGPEVVPVLEQLQPVSAGAFDMLFSHGGYHAGTTGIGLVLDAIAADPVARRDSGIWDFVDQHYGKRNLKLLALPVSGSQGYQVFLRKPPEGGDFKGLKIRGTTVYHNLITGLGGAPVVLPGTEIYSALEKGVVDGAAWAMIGALDFKWYEVAKYVARPTFGVSTHLLMINRDVWNKLSNEEHKVLLDVGRALELESIKSFDQLVARELAELTKRGVQEVQLKASKERLEELWSSGLWQVAAKGSARADAEALHQLAVSKKLTK